MYICVNICVQPEVDLQGHFLSLSTLFFKTGLSWNPDLPDSSRPACEYDPGLLLSPFAQRCD